MLNNLKLLICPECRCDIDTYLRCTNCNFLGKIQDEVLYLHKEDYSWEACKKESLGWVNIHKELNIYRENPDHYILPDGAPHLREFYKNVILHLNALYKQENFSGKTVLDLGSGSGWVSNKLAQKKANVISLDCNDDIFIGLKRSKKLMEYFNTKYTLLIADMQNIPLKDNSMDVVLMVDSLHHFTNLNLLFKEIKRVLKKDGTFYALNEACRPDYIEEEATITKDLLEIKHGINERRPKLWEYLSFGKPVHLEQLNKFLGLSSESLFFRGKGA